MHQSPVADYLARNLWLADGRSERARRIREQLMSQRLSPELQAIMDRRNVSPDFPPPSIDGLEVVELTVLEITAATEPR